MDDLKTTMTLLLHADSGIGKSWLADTSPGPRLVIDLEGRAQYTPSQPKVLWDPRNAPPRYDGTWETCIVVCPDFDTLQRVYDWLRAGNHDFVSVVVDSLMEAQKRCIDVIAPTEALQQQEWGTLLRRLEKLVRSYRDLTLYPTNTLCVVVFIVGSIEANGRWRPLLQGALKDTCPYYLDVVGYLYMAPQLDPDTGQTSFVRSLLVHAQPGFVAKDGTGKLPGPVITNPNLTEMVSLLHAAGKPEATAPVAQEEAA